MNGTPLLRRIVTLVGTPFKENRNYNVRLGVPINFLIENNGGFAKIPSKVIIGGPMMGVPQFRLDVPVIKNTSAVVSLTEKEAKIPDEQPCIRCGKCVDHCPMQLMPLYLHDFAQKDELDKCEDYNVTACIECGCCSFECPSKRHLVQNIRIAKHKVLAIQKQR